MTEQVSQLFKDHPDLLDEFKFFLPDSASSYIPQLRPGAGPGAGQGGMVRQGSTDRPAGRVSFPCCPVLRCGPRFCIVLCCTSFYYSAAGLPCPVFHALRVLCLNPLKDSDV